MGKETGRTRWENIQKPEGATEGDYGHAFKALRWLDTVESETTTYEQRAVAVFLAESHILAHVEVGKLPPESLVAAEINQDELHRVMESDYEAWHAYGIKRLTRNNRDVLGYEEGVVNLDGNINGYDESELIKEERQVEKVLFQKS